MRPLGISGIEDKIVQELTRRILEAIYEPSFLETSYGFRPGRSCHDALRRLNREVMSAPVNWIADLDLAQFFDTMPHTEILAVLAERVQDKKVVRLIARMLKAGVQTPGGVVQDELGSPQGSIVSPALANVFVDKVLDQWVARVVKHHCRGYCELIRYADDSSPRRRGKEAEMVTELQPCGTRDGGRPSGAGWQEQAPSHLQRQWSRAPVVSVQEKADQESGRSGPSRRTPVNR